MTHPALRCTCEAHTELEGTMLAPALPALHCAACGSTVLRLDDYRDWRERHPQQAAVPSASAAPLPQEESSPGVRRCPSCARLMQRHRVGADPDFWLDRCSPCQWVWFDRHEWEALADAGLSLRLPELLSEAWQRQLRESEARQGREQALRARHGDACIDELARVREWLQSQPARDELLNLLRAGW